jgi:lipopolysaccharide transport system permease protein
MANKAPQSDVVRIVIRPTKGWRSIDFKELWLYRELLYFFTWKDIKVRYKQTLLGVLWVILQPLITMVIFSIFFGKFAKVPSEGVPYAVFVCAGLLPWTLFAQGVTRSVDRILSDTTLIKKVYFPRLLIPISASLSALIDFFVAFGILILLMLFYHFVPMVNGIVLFPFLVILIFFSTIGVGFWLSAINVMYRDVRYITPFFIQMGLFITPVIYPTTVVPERYLWVLYLNPMAGAIEAFRASLLGHKAIPALGLGLSMAMAAIFFVSGIYFFRRMERQFADVI